MTLVGIGALAREFKVDPKSIRLAVATGQLTRRKDSLFDLEQARKDWASSHNADLGHDNSRGAGIPKLPPASDDDLRAAAADESDLPLNGERPVKGSDFAKARALSQIYDARLKKLRCEERAKALVPACDVEDAADRTIRCIKDACFSIPSRIAAQIAVESSTERCYQLIESEIDTVFRDFAEGKIA